VCSFSTKICNDTKIIGKFLTTFISDANFLNQNDPFHVEEIINIDDMVKSKMHLGHKYPLNFNNDFKRFTYGVKNGFTVIDLAISYVYLKVHKNRRAANYAALIARSGGVILFYSYTKRFELICQHAARSCDQYFYCGTWKTGTFVQPEKYLKPEMVIVDKAIKKSYRLPDLIIIVGLGSYSFPDMRKQFLSSLTDNEIKIGIFASPANDLLTDASIKFIPTIGLVDSDTNPNLVNFPVPGNDDNVSSVDYFYTTLSRAIKSRSL
ncbi:hypothetical protein MXB_4162, partial [Myxobolus squamalis]